LAMRSWIRKLPRWMRPDTPEEINRDIKLAKLSTEALRKVTSRSTKRSGTPVVSTRTIVCRETGEKHSALLLIHEDGAVDVKCPGECAICDYERLL